MSISLPFTAASGRPTEGEIQASARDRSPAKVLVVDDDPDILELLEATLQRAGFEVHPAENGYEGLRLLYRERPALVTLDILLPGMDGHEVLRQIREFSNVPVIIVSALSGLAHVTQALDAGAADYLPKPFHPSELISRVKAVLRRQPSEPETLRAAIFPRAGISVDAQARRLALNGQPVHLTPKEFDLLWLLVKCAGGPVSYSTICREVWGEDSARARDRAKWVVFLLRRKIEPDPNCPRILLNRPGYGYEFKAA